MRCWLFTKKYLFCCVFIIVAIPLATKAQHIAKSFELRYYSNDTAANGETDFKGKSQYLNTKQRVTFLKHYADYASNFFEDADYNTEVATDKEVQQALQSIKPQPQPHVRTRIPLRKWKWIGYKKGQHRKRRNDLQRWLRMEGVSVEKGHLNIKKSSAHLKWNFPSQSWRFAIRWKVKAPKTTRDIQFRFSDREKVNAATVGMAANSKIFYYTADNKRRETGTWAPSKWYSCKIEFDLAATKRKKDLVRYNFYVNGKLIADYVPMQRVVTNGVGYAQNFTSIAFVNTFTADLPAGTQLDSLWGVGYHLTGRENYPYTTETFLDENFESKPPIKGWQQDKYKDTIWNKGRLPIVHGSERNTGEALYLRKTIEIGDFKRAVLNIETIDPGGEIWINGRVAKVITNQHPVKLDVTSFLKKDQKNLIAIKVNPFYLTKRVGEVMPHSSLDFNIGWFAGRSWLDLTGPTTIDNLFVYTQKIENHRARLKTRLKVTHRGPLSYHGRVVINAYPWYPNETDQPAASDTVDITIGHGEKKLSVVLDVPKPNLWMPNDPNLYKIETILLDKNQHVIDDNVTTTGIRTLSQKGGTFRLNGKPAMLNGSGLFGFRSPLEKMVTWHRSPPLRWLAKEIMMVKKMNGNLMRVHVHGWEFPARNINDPRLPELADQMGLMLIWGTPAWIRTGSGWGDIDFKGLPKYIRQVRNHPSIAMWELANHTQSFKQRDVSESNLYVKKAYDTVYPMDPSRLISFNSYIYHLHYGNDKGTIDHNGHSITPSPAWTAPMVTRGNQDGIVGYGRDWTALRNWPDTYRKDMLNSKERAYFNFEHEESAGQPNWNLVKGKPWYHLHSYEWDYDKGSIGRHLHFDEWRESQAWQAFSAWESMKKQRILGYDGFSWMGLHGGPNSATYRKPLTDFQGHAKLVYWINKMLFQPVVAGSDNVDVVYGPDDSINPIVMNLGKARKVNVTVRIKNPEGKKIDQKMYWNVDLSQGRTVTRLPAFRPNIPAEGYYLTKYIVKAQDE